MTVALAGLMAGMVRVVSGPGHLAPSATPLRGGAAGIPSATWS
jgi:hypothetical protein